ncbi:MAG: extracellular solute-binding protein [Bacilli bacterium]|jgi:multiple sugar transport system substrate-binding protein|nr:extracellular solute-binding protein [Bacilli bacterium]
MKNHSHFVSRWVWAASVLLALTLTGCDFGQNNSAASEDMQSSFANDTTAKVTMWYPSGAEYNDALNDAISRFQQTYPNVTFKIVKKAGLDIYQSYLIALNDDNSRPDLAIVDHVYIPNLAFEDQVANIGELSAGDGVESNFPSTLYSANSYNGSAYGLPLSANTVVLMGNMDILNAAGIATMPKTYSELLADCQAIKEKTSYTPFAQPINETFCAMGFSSYVAREKGQMVSDDYKTVQLDSPNVKKAVNDWVGLSKYASQNEYEEGKFYGGGVGFIEMGSWNLAKVSQGETSFKLGLSEMVTIDSETPNYSGLGLYSMVIAKKSAVKQATYRFSKFLATDKTFQMAFAKVKALLPVTKDALADDYYAKNQYLSCFATQLTKVAPRPGTPVWSTLEQQIVNMLYGAVTASDSAGVDAAIESAQKKSQEATNRKFNG